MGNSGQKDLAIRVGCRVRLLPEDEVAEVYRYEEKAGRVLVGLIMERTKEARTLLLSPQEVARRLEVLPSLKECFLVGEGILPRQQCVAFADSLRMRLAYTFDPHYAVSVTQVDLLPHQVDAVYRHILPQARVRFLLADDPGLGKTIMAGLVLKELKARGLVRTALIVVPAHLQDQWRREMSDWFREDFTILNRGVMQGILGDDFFSRNPQLLVSVDFARRKEIREILKRRCWDIVIVDEAHKFSATRYGNKVRKTQRYELGEALSRASTHMLFLTATPHKGDDDAYFLLLDLLQPRLFACVRDLKEATKDKPLPFVLRRSKEQVTDLQGRPLFKRREVKTLAVSLTDAEKRLYDAVSNYVRRWYQVVSKKTDRRSRNIALALTVLQRRLSSSLFAVRESLRRRRAKLQNLLHRWLQHTEEDGDELVIQDEESWQDISEQTSKEWESLQEKLEGMTAAATPDELQQEINELDRLIQFAIHAEKAGEEAKVCELRRLLEERLRHHPKEKLIIFTEFKDTLFALKRKLESWGFPPAVIHGGLNLQARIEQERYFRDHAQVLIGTDAAGEGLNLQFCRLMLNFDLPWNPNRLEQRMGRIHRYGQKRDCYVFNMLYTETREGRVLERLMEKLERMRERLGDTIYDVIGHLLSGVHLEELIMQALLKQDTQEVDRLIDVDIERRVDEYRRALHESALAGHFIDLPSVLSNERESRIKRLVPWDVERFTRLAVPLLGGECSPVPKKPGVFRLRVPTTFLKQHNLAQESFARGIRVAFDRKTARDAGAEFFASGHPLFEALCDHFLTKSRPVKGVLIHPKGEEGILWLFRAGVEDSNAKPVLQRLIMLFWNAKTNQVTEVDPRFIWDLNPFPEDASPPASLVEQLPESEAKVRKTVLARLERLRAEAEQRRQREVRIKKQWLEKSYDQLIAESNSKLFEYARRSEQGEDMSLAIKREEENLKSLIREKQARLKELELEQTLSLTEPILEMVVLVAAEAPRPQPAPDHKDTRTIEEIGMEVALDYERAHNRMPRDVSKEYLGYDIYSEGEDEVRYIEVKAFATSGDLHLTPHEWQMAQRLADEYWLYVVENAKTQPRLCAIQNPAAKLKPQQITGIVSYAVRDWKNYAQQPEEEP